MPYKDPAAKAARAKELRHSSPEAREKHNARTRRHNVSEKGLASKRKYKKTEAGRASAARYEANPQVKMRKLLRRRILHAFKQATVRNVSAIQDLGMPFAELIDYFRTLPTWEPHFTIENHGKVWHVDHIKALGLFDLTDPEQARQAVHYTNLQPLSTERHIEKTKDDVRLIRLSISVGPA